MTIADVADNMNELKAVMEFEAARMSHQPVSLNCRMPKDHSIPTLKELVQEGDPSRHYKYCSLIGQVNGFPLLSACSFLSLWKISDSYDYLRFVFLTLAVLDENFNFAYLMC